MHRAAGKRQLKRDSSSRQGLTALRSQRRKLTMRLAKLDAAIANREPAAKTSSVAEIDRWFEELTAGLPELLPLPNDFSRSDLYDDHD